ncbi:hypothetical protein Pint_08563 [Pistacia integerrima]|uniref:Uncharacterized protein n=1 Tax=Pistacia integerrima TaxID=434235 RepID=A0ACC0XWG4_9ROSI|nr:hypothetical protein Pint_08563 [Pistacia integerrima]
MKNHLAGTYIQVKPCSQVPEDVKMKFQELLVAKKVNKDDDDNDMVDIFKQQDVNPNTGKIDSFLSKGKKGSGSNSKQRTLNEVVKDREKVIQVEVFRLVDGDAKPAIGYIYEAMRRANNQIAKNFNNAEHQYREIWKIIDTRWNFQLQRPLHAAAYYLNPK